MKKNSGESSRNVTAIHRCWVCWFWMLFFALSCEGFARQRPEVSLRFSFSGSAVGQNEPVVLMITLHNGLSQPVTLTLGAQGIQFFHFVLSTPDGKVLESSFQPGRGPDVAVFDGRGKVTLAPGTDYMRPLLMNRWFDFPIEGTYRLTAELTSDVESSDEAIRLASQTLEFHVKGRDAARLTTVCAKLAHEAEVAQDVDSAEFPSLALSYIQDPIAVPYLAQVLSAHALQYAHSIEGLERVGNDDAVRVLLSSLRDTYGDIAELAARALRRMEVGISNPELKDAVKESLERFSIQARSEYISHQITFLDYRSPSLQLAAIQNLINVEGGLKQAAPTLQRLLNDPDQPANVRAAAKDALQLLRTSESVRPRGPESP